MKRGLWKTGDIRASKASPRALADRAVVWSPTMMTFPCGAIFAFKALAQRTAGRIRPAAALAVICDGGATR